MHQTESNPFNGRLGIYMVFAGKNYALRESRMKALRYANEAMLRGDTPTAIVSIGQDERLDVSAIWQGWKELGVPLSRA
jgi:hypothetical protein